MKEFNLRELTKRGCERREDKDFRDDGTKFKIVQYKTLEISYTKYEDEYFLSIRVDYTSRGLEYNDIPKEVFKAADEFNGVYEVDPDKVITNAEYIIQELNRIQNEVAKELEKPQDITPLEKRTIKEIEIANKAINDFKSSEVIYKITSEYDLKRSIEKLHSLEKTIENLSSIEWNTLEPLELRHRLAFLKEYGSIKIKETDYSIEFLYELIDKYSK